MYDYEEWRQGNVSSKKKAHARTQRLGLHTRQCHRRAVGADPRLSTPLWV